MITNAVDKYTGEQLIREPGSGGRHMLSIDTALARIDTKQRNINFEDVLYNSFKMINQNAYYIIISNKRSEEIINTYKTSKINGASSFFIVPEIKNYEVKEQIPDMIKWDIEY